MALFGGSIGAYVRTKYFNRFLRNYIFGKKIDRILDAGCGTGDHAFYLARKLPGATVYGYDLAGSESYKSNIHECLRKKRESGDRNIVFQEKDLRTLNEKEKYDLVYSIDVLEHILGNRLVIENIFQSLKEGGLFYLAMPYDKANRRLLPAFFFKGFDAWADHEHIGEQYSLEELTSLMKEIGFTILEAKYTFGVFGKLAWELDKVFECMGPAGRLSKPFLKIIGWMDIYWNNKEGDLLVIARR